MTRNSAGGEIGWATAALRTDLVEKLIVLNLPHPRCLVRELAPSSSRKRLARAFQEEGTHLALTLDGCLAQHDVDLSVVCA